MGNDRQQGITVALSQPSAQLLAYYQAAAAATGVPEGLLIAQGRQESGFQTDVTSPSGAKGIAQFMPATAASLGINPNDPQSAIMGQAKLMASYLSQFGGDVAKALAAYNAGPGAVAQYGGVPPYQQTQDYVTAIISAWTGQAGASDVNLNAGTVTTPSGTANATTAAWWNPLPAIGGALGDVGGAIGGAAGQVGSDIASVVKDAVDSAFSSLFNAVRPVVIEAVLVAGGVGLVVAGAWRSVSSARATVDDALDPDGSGGEL